MEVRGTTGELGELREGFDDEGGGEGLREQGGVVQDKEEDSIGGLREHEEHGERDGLVLLLLLRGQEKEFV